MENLNFENKANGIKDLVWKYQSATHSYKPNTNVSLKMLGVLLYLAKTNNLSLVQNNSDDSSVVLYMDKPYIDTMAGNIGKNWEERGIHNMTICSKLPKSDRLAGIVAEYTKELRSVSDPAFIFEVAESLMNSKMTSADYLAILDFAIQQHAESIGKSLGMFSQPKELAQLVDSLISTSCKSIYNPFAGALSYATILSHYDKFDAVETDRDIWELAILRVALTDNFDKVSLTLGDVANWTKEKYDAIITTPPFGLRMNMESPLFNRKESAETVALKRFGDSTTENGELFTYVPLSVLELERVANLRDELTAKGWLDAIIVLPQGIMANTQMPVALVILRKSHSGNEPVKMIDASRFFTRQGHKRVLDVNAIVEAYKDSSKHTAVSLSDIAAKQWSWYVNEYIESANRQIPDGYVQMQLDSILESPAFEDDFDDINGALVTIRDLSTAPYNCLKSPKDFPVSTDLTNTVKCCEPVLLIPKFTTSFKPTFCNASKESPIFVKRNIVIFNLTNENIDPGYLCCELADYRLTGSSFSVQARARVMRVKLAFPPTIEEQRAIYQARYKESLLGGAKESGLQEVINKMKADYINVVRTRKHDMMPYLSELKEASKSIRQYIKMIPDAPNLQDDMTWVMDRFDDAHNHLSALMAVFSEEDAFGKAERLDLNSLLKKIASQNNAANTGFEIGYYCDESALREYGLAVSPDGENNQKEEPLIVEIAKLDFDRMVENIVANARKHGFTDSSRNNYRIDISLTVDSERNMFRIDFSNNGNPLPKGVDKYTYGLLGEKSGSTGGTGQGGHIVKSIVEHFGGDYDVYAQDNNTIVSVFLPIANQTEA